MEFVILLIVLIITYILLTYIFDINIKNIKMIADDKKLDELTQKYPENIEICKEYLKILNNENVKIEEDKNSNTTLYLVMNNKILIANLKESYTRIQTIAHECLHSIQNKKLLWFNFVFSNIYLVYFLVVCILAIFKLLPYKMMFVAILILLGFVYYIVRAYLENDAMIKARFLAKEYLEKKKISDKEEIDEIIGKYDKLNNLGIKCVNFQLFGKVLLKIIILIGIFVIIK